MAGERQITASEVMAAYGSQITQAATSYGLDPNLIVAVIMAESNGNPNSVSNKKAVGLMQLEPATAGLTRAQLLDPATNINAGAKYLSQQLTNTGGNLTQSLANYNAGPGRAKTKPWSNETNIYVAKVEGFFGNTNTSIPGTQTSGYGVNDAAAVTAINVSGTALTTDQYKTIYDVLNPPLIIETNLYELPWFADRNIVQQKRPVAFPVSFQIFLQPNFQSLLPVTIELKASITSHEKAMQHIVTKQKTRTGLLIDLWGMQLDSITGEGSTGLMQNQFGVTDFISLSSPSSDALAALKHGFTSLAFSNLTSASIPAPSIAQQQAQEAVDAAVRQGLTPVAVVSVAGSVTNAAAIQTESFRVAARDAFAEFLALFKNNGNVWYHSAYNGITTAAQTDPDAWSSTTGLSTFETVSSRNDVMSRGNVVMYFRNAAYYGYFKSLTWTMDAKTPYSWNFSFNFAVESTTLNFTLP